jgi:hypothetical protein
MFVEWKRSTVEIIGRGLVSYLEHGISIGSILTLDSLNAGSRYFIGVE